jgi:NTE family protein
LKKGLQISALCHLIAPELLFRIVLTNLVSRPTAFAATILRKPPPFRRWASRSDALEAALSEIIPDVDITQVAHTNLDIIFNACELRTGTAFRFGNRRSGGWRFGELKDNKIPVAHAVTCSAAYPLLLPAIDREYMFVNKGELSRQRVIITDGGVYDNLGITCLEPGRNKHYSLHAYNVDYIICCNAGYGQFSGDKIPFGFYSRVTSAFESIFRKVQDSGLNRLHMHKQAGKIKGFILPYLGQQDRNLPFLPPDLVQHDEIVDYPTNFAGMQEQNLKLITKRGEQLTRFLLSYYCPEL